jgi:xanthine dehydrogenase YagR molybdenum-binding subunit
MTTLTRTVGAGVSRIEAVEKVTGAARYAAEVPLDDLAFGWAVTSTIARGRVRSVDVDAALAQPGVLAVLHHGNAPRLGDADDDSLRLLQDDAVPHHGWVVALVVATTSEQAREVAATLRVEYDEDDHDVVFDRHHPRLFTPETVNPDQPSESSKGDVEEALAGADVVVDHWYSTPAEHNNPMEPHATTATWDGDRLTVYDANQGATSVKQSLSKLFGLEPGQVRVHSEHVGGGFGSKGTARPPVVLAAMASRQLGRPVRVVLTRQQMFALTGYRTPTAQRVRLGASSDGRLVAVDHLAESQTSTVLDFAEQTATITRMMYASDAIATSHRLVRLDVPTPRWMRAPGEAPGSFGLESAMDELAVACGLDPVELRLRNEPDEEPTSGHPFSSRNLVACLQEGARRSGWHDRDARPGVRREGRWLRGTGVAASTYPSYTSPSTASATAHRDGGYEVRVTAADIGTGARTALTQVAAETLGVPLGQVRVRIGDSDFGKAAIAGGSMGTASWSWAVVEACRALQSAVEAGTPVPPDGLTVTADTTELVEGRRDLARHAFGAQFAEVLVDVRTGEVRVPRLLGVFAAGRIVNATTARSQLMGGMTFGLSMALHEESVMDHRFGDFVNHDLAGYHVATNADVPMIEVDWIDEHDDELNPLGIKGIGELGIVGTAAAIGNALWHATGVRLRDLPLRPDRVIEACADVR